MSDDLVIAEPRGPVCIVRLNREAKLNAMSEALCARLLAVLAGPEVRSSRVVVLAGSARAFSAGADLTEFTDDDQEAAGDQARDILRRTQYREDLLEHAQGEHARRDARTHAQADKILQAASVEGVTGMTFGPPAQGDEARIAVRATQRHLGPALKHFFLVLGVGHDHSVFGLAQGEKVVG